MPYVLGAKARAELSACVTASAEALINLDALVLDMRNGPRLIGSEDVDPAYPMIASFVERQHRRSPPHLTHDICS